MLAMGVPPKPGREPLCWRYFRHQDTVDKGWAGLVGTSAPG